jgi:hypothetical protein
MNERIKKLAEQAMEPEDGAVWWVGDGDLKKFAELIVQECVNCYSPDDSATDWADKMKKLIEP